MQIFIIGGRLPGYNELHARSWQASYKLKKDAMDTVIWAVKIAHIKTVHERCTIKISCYEPNARRDEDNVLSGASKIILDALQKAGIIAGDGRKYVHIVYAPVRVDRKNPRVEVEIIGGLKGGQAVHED